MDLNGLLTQTSGRVAGGLVLRRHVLQGVGAAALLAGGGVLASRPAAAVTRADVDAATGEVNILAWEGYEPEDAFKDLAVTVKRSFVAQNDDTITKTGNPGDFDLMTIFQGQLSALIKLDRIQPIDTTLLNHYGELFPFFREDPSLQRAGKVYAVPIAWGPIIVCYDEDQTAKPESYRDLMAPALKGKVAMVDDAYAGISTFARFAGFEDANRLTHAQLDDVMKLAAEFKPQLLTIAPSYGEIPSMFKRGEIAASIVDIMNTVAAARADGKKVSGTVPKEGGISYVDCWEMVTGAANPAGAYAVIDATISPAGQAIIGNYTYLGMVNPNALPDIDAAINELYPYDDLDAAFKLAPLFGGAPIDDEGGTLATHPEWVQRWSEFKAL
ncbi:MAG: extracellular solute-binding protein [Alphaproteobacteria bacterium]|nr:extracellular solute-binding protein [Alphaproteobacteria bacterium]